MSVDHESVVITDDEDSNGSCDNEREDGLPSDFPPVEVCAERCKSFAEITSTDEALAQFYLQDREWNLEKSLVDYFADLEERNSSKKTAEPIHVELSSEDESCPAKSAKIENKSEEEDNPDDLLKVISWNIDGLDPKNIDLRTNSVCSIIKRSQADIALLQEVVPHTLAIIESVLGKDYKIIHSGIEDYFTAIVIHRRRLRFVKDRVFEFSNSVMGRKLHAVDVIFKDKHKLYFLNTHLESTREYSQQRKEQLVKSFRNIAKIPATHSVIFSGDLNLRDAELEEIGGIPSGMVDVWQNQGERPEAKFTWDMSRNDNLSWNARFKPKCRFDRMYFKPSTSQGTTIKSVYFGLIGIERLLPHRCFPSDHWGLYAHFQIDGRP